MFTKQVYPLGVMFVCGLAFSVIGCAETTVHRDGQSTAVITQSGGGPSATEVTRTPNTRTVVTRSGNNQSVIIQSTDPAAMSTERQRMRDTSSARETQDRIDARIDDATARFDDRPTRTDSSSSYDYESSGPSATAEEFKARLMDRIRPRSTR